MASIPATSKKLVESVTVRVPPMASSLSSSPPNPEKLCRSVSAFCSPRNGIHYPSNFKRSGAPARVMFYQDESWTDLPNRVVEVLRAGFVERKAVVNVEIEGSTYSFDFVRMLQIDSGTGSQRSIAWIDEQGKCFFPKFFVSEEVDIGSENPKIGIEIRVDLSGTGKRKREEPVDEDEVTSSVRQLIEDKISGAVLWPNVKLLREDERAFEVVSNLFLTGIKRVDSGASVTAIHHCGRSGPLDKARVEVFQKQLEMTKAARGTANVGYAWYGASASDIGGILKVGFGVSSKVSGPESYGVGLHLSHLSLPHASGGLLEPDDNGKKHVILCRVILGNVEKVEAGSQQCHPSSPEFDTGADDPQSPKWYVVWSANMNRHVLPECVVSYKPSDHMPAQFGGSAQTKYPVGVLFSKIRSSLAPSKVQELSTLLAEFKAGKVPKNDFFKQFRSVTGDQLLLSAIQEMRG